MKALRILGALAVVAGLGYVYGLDLRVLMTLAAFAVVAGGYAPTGTEATELTAITRRAFIPKLIVQIGQATPYLAAGMANAQPASGGLSSVTVPVQGAAMTFPAATGYAGNFAQPGIASGIQDAEFNLCAYVCPIGFLGFEALVQMDAAVIPRIEAVMNDAGNQTAQLLSTDALTNATYGTISMDGLPLIGAVAGFYGNIDRSVAANAFWKANIPTPLGGLPTRKLMAQCIASAAKFNGGEMPTMGLMGLGTWAALQQDFIGIENIYLTPGTNLNGGATATRSAFPALMVNGVPIYADIGVPEGPLYLLNMRYLSFYIHEAAAFAFTGFASTLPVRQLGYIGALVIVMQQLCTKPKSVTTYTGFTALVL